MKKFLRRLTLGNILIAVIFFLFGILLIEKPGLSIDLISILLGIVVILTSLMSIVKFISDSTKIHYYRVELFFGIIGILLGCLIIFNPFSWFNFFIIGFGIFMIIEGLLDLKYALFFKKNKEEIWPLNIGIAVVSILLGIILILNPFSGVMMFTKALGIFIMANAVLNIIANMLFYKRINAIIKLLN